MPGYLLRPPLADVGKALAMNQGKTYVVAISGASGSIYGIRLVKALAETSARVLVVLSDAGARVMAHEAGLGQGRDFVELLASCGVAPPALKQIQCLEPGEIGAGPASGSFVHHGMAVAPCSMKTLAAVAQGFADTLITRACDVSIKERRPLVLVPRETPLSLIHIENMARAARAGAVILPPCPSFYTAPRDINDLADTVVARIMDHLGAEHELLKRWGS